MFIKLTLATTGNEDLDAPPVPAKHVHLNFLNIVSFMDTEIEGVIRTRVIMVENSGRSIYDVQQSPTEIEDMIRKSLHSQR